MPGLPNDKVLKFRLDAALHAEVTAVSEETGWSVSTILREALRLGLPAARQALLTEASLK
jgi:antitoxin component of RelBE/YafQ-DinJ toxin-antitoxin module